MRRVEPDQVHRRADGTDTPARLLLAVLGALLTLGPPLLVSVTAWWTTPALALVPPGVLLIILSAFFGRVHGTVRFGLVEITIDAPPAASEPVSRPTLERGASHAAARGEILPSSATGAPTDHPEARM